MKIIVGITGASGAVYSKRLLECLCEMKIETNLVISKAGVLVINNELNMDVVELKKLANVTYEIDDLTAPIASGSNVFDAMIIIPSSMNTISSISTGISANLITRAASVQIKENRKLILVPRETPLNAIHLENLANLARLGVIILPAMPGFYHNPESIEDILDFLIGKILDQINIKHNLFKRWGE